MSAAFENQKAFIIPTKRGDGSTRIIDGTTAIAVSFIFLAYILHPAIETAYNRVKAYRAWRAIEKREQVEVTSYSMAAEIFGARAIWDAARIITVLLAAFSLASWGLELQLGLADIEKGPVNLLNSPPHVILRSDNNASVWEVLSPSDGLDAEQGSLWNMDDNYAKGTAQSRYYVESYELDMVNGDITVAWWSDDVEDMPELFYNIDGIKTTVESLECATEPLTSADIFQGETQWGTVHECEEGPPLSEASQAEDLTKTASPPAIILTEDATSTVHIIVEESSSYPSFLYSVWTSGDEVADDVEIHHVFYIASTMRLAEAVVTGIVHGWDNGGGCFGLLRQYSENHFTDTSSNETRACPFGENPEFGVVSSLDEVEAIEAGVEVNVFVLLCGVWVMGLASIGFAWSLCLRKSIGMDIYDRDELMQAMWVTGTAMGADANTPQSNKSPPSSIRIFVRKEDSGQMSVALSKVVEGKGWYERLFRRGSTVGAHDEPAPVAASTVDEHNAQFGGAAVPVGPGTVWLEGRKIRTRTARAFPGPDGNFLYPSIELAASPVPSTVGSPACARSPIVAGHHPLVRRGPSVMFDGSVYSLDSSSTDQEDVETGRGVGGANEGRRNSVGDDSLVVSGKNSRGWDALGTDLRTMGRKDGETLVALSGATTPGPSGESSPVPSRGLTTTDFTLGPAQISSLLRAASERTGSAAGSEDEVKECGESKVALSGATTPGSRGGSPPVPSRGMTTTDFTLGPAENSRLRRAASERTGPAVGNEHEEKECGDSVRGDNAGGEKGIVARALTGLTTTVFTLGPAENSRLLRAASGRTESAAGSKDKVKERTDRGDHDLV